MVNKEEDIMAFEALVTPAKGTSASTEIPHTRAGFVVGLVGVGIAMVAFFANLSAASTLANGDVVAAKTTLAWSFGLTTLAFGTVKFGIAIVLIGILVRIWFRLESIKETLPALKSDGEDRHRVGSETNTDYGVATVTKTEPAPLPIHRMAKTMWAPMLVMGYMILVAGTIMSFVWSSNVGSDPGAAIDAAAWTQGLQFLGEALLLSGISFLLASILANLRSGGGEVQRQLGLPVVTLKMPVTAKAFIALMMMGLVAGVVQFVLYVVGTSSTDAGQIATAAAWLGPLRELSLGLLLSGIVLALATIANVLGFQFNRIKGIVTAS